MVSQSIIALDKSLLELFEPSTSPEKALQLLASSFFKLEDYSEGDKELPVIFRSPIFLAYIRFVMDRQPDGKVEGIWEDILKKAFMYLRKYVCIYYLLEEILEESRAIYPPNIFPWLVPALRYKIVTWIVNVLRNHDSCPNPYVRLEIFSLHMKLGYSSIEYGRDDRESLCNTFRHTMCEVNPHCFVSSGNEYDPMFDVYDLNMMLRELYNNITYVNINDLNFLSNVTQLTGVFATHVGNDSVQDVIMSCSNILNSLWDMSDQVTCQAIQNYVVETICEITATAIFSKESESYQDVISRRNLLINDLNMDTKLCDLPRLLLLRQVQGPRQVRQHALLLGGM